MNPQEFAQKVKAKYPQYKDVDDVELATKMVEKYPEYKSSVNFSSSPAKDIIATATPGGSTAIPESSVAKNTKGMAPQSTEMRTYTDDFKGDVQKIANDTKRVLTTPVEADINTGNDVGSKSLTLLGNAGRFVGSLFNRSFEKVNDATGGKIGDVAKATAVKINDATGGKAGELLSKTAGFTAEKWNALKESDPATAQRLDDLFQISQLIPAGAGTKKAVGLLDDAVEGGLKASEKALAKTVDVVDAVPTAVKEVSRTPAQVAIDIITPIDPKVESVLNPTVLIPQENLKNIPIDKIIAQAEDKTAKYDRYVKQGEKAIESNYQKTPLTLAGDRATESANILQNKINKQNLLKKEALGVVGDKKVNNIDKVVELFNKEAQDKIGLVFNVAEDGTLEIGNAIGRKSKIAFDPADNKLLTDAYKTILDLGSNPSVREIDDTVDALQDLLYKRTNLTAIPVNSQVESVLKSITGKLNTAVKRVAGEQYTKANAKMHYMIDTFETLNKSLGKEGERGASLMKQLFGPAGEKPRRLFSDIKKLTGIDLTEEATLAKFVMENLGDARQASLLEEAIRGNVTSTAGAFAEGAKRLVNKLQDPIGKARRVINKNQR